MEKLKKILEAEIAQRKLAMKHNHLNKAEIEEELDELNRGSLLDYSNDSEVIGTIQYDPVEKELNVKFFGNDR